MSADESAVAPVRMIAVDLDGTLIGVGGRVSERNLLAIRAAERAGVEVVVATGRRHSYAMKLLRGLGFRDRAVLVSSNGTVTRRIGSELMERNHLSRVTAEWLVGQVREFRNALVVTFDTVDARGEDRRGALVVEEMEDLHGSIGKWMVANEPYIAHVRPIERSLEMGEPIQMMLCGTVERMRRAEACLREDGRVQGVGAADRVGVEVVLHRTEYPERDLSILDILPAGCSKGVALLRLAERWGFGAGEMMAIGDNWNDLPMLEVAGWPVLMGNAPEELREMAEARGWEMTGRNDEDGVAEAIERMLRGRGEMEGVAFEEVAGAGAR
jgi:hydroxymethylpyrimidine pyrophosphatase-like HAD family hydrolase